MKTDNTLLLKSLTTDELMGELIERGFTPVGTEAWEVVCNRLRMTGFAVDSKHPLSVVPEVPK